MSKLLILPSSKVFELFEYVRRASNVELRDRYINGVFNFEDVNMISTNIEIGEEPILIQDKGNIFENARKVHEFLRLENEMQSSDSRVWATVCHTCFHDYLREKHSHLSDEDLSSKIQRNWFQPSTSDKRSLMRNEIASLWWGVELTYDTYSRNEDFFNSLRVKDDPYYYTRILLSKADIFIV